MKYLEFEKQQQNLHQVRQFAKSFYGITPGNIQAGKRALTTGLVEAPSQPEERMSVHSELPWPQINSSDAVVTSSSIIFSIQCEAISC
jgi:hypothetical protein